MKPSPLFFLPAACIFLFSCQTATNAPNEQDIEAIKLNNGDLIWCGPESANFGSVRFEVSASPEVRKDFDQAIAILHSFEYIEAEKAFAAIIKKSPSCAMAYWGVAMANYHPLWEPPREDELAKGAAAIKLARSLKNKTPRETEYIEAIGAYYDNFKTLDHKTRGRKYEEAMSALYDKYPDDKEAAIFYALALNSTADPTDKTYTHQKKAGDILTKLSAQQPGHPGIIHYIIHNYDNPDLASYALPSARKYASVAPASAHAQHMPSHIFIRLGLWDEAISSNIASVNSARCYAEKASLSGNFDEELHGLDYLVYGYLQKGNNAAARQQWQYIQTIESVSAENLKVAYAYAAIPSRFVLENRQWKEAAQLQLYPDNFPWQKFPWQKGVVTFTRLMGKVHTGDMAGAAAELDQLKLLQRILLQQKDLYKAKQLEVQIKTGAAWIDWKQGKKNAAIEWMRQAADLEDGTEKHPVTPGEVLPARELLGDLYMEMKQYDKALEAYEADLKRHTNRFNALYGAATAAEQLNREGVARQYYQQLLKVADAASPRAELNSARRYLGLPGALAKR